MKSILVAAIALIFVLAANGQTAYVTQIEKWRTDHQAELLSDSGWFTVAGLFWLKPGANTVGAGPQYDVQLTKNFAGGKFGEIDFEKGSALLTVDPGINAVSGGKTVTSINLLSDGKSDPTVVSVGSQSFFLIERDGRTGVRLKDTKSEQRSNFHGLKWYPTSSKFRVTATFVAFPKPKEILIPNVLGSTFKMKSPGILRFRLNGKPYSLLPVEEGDHLFIIFRDITSKTETYGAGRFLYAAKAANGKVVLDFNKAENPPCAFTQ
ncbi:MAG TPA: DUF1684 domain-containing protein, partial [Pyrinomonadaceae bacterium]|nr:DUF1684 domain-containing protein [Pyrinomonadaceae bacterium]